ncbi:MAG: phosphatase PAP2 family protein [Deltaproteobacteria bacterium]|nr:phosphatase PAP2 family protein [Deltaproteobacteria bacterium]
MAHPFSTLALPVFTLGGSLVSALVLRHRRDEVARFAVAVPVALAAGKIIKQFVHAPRPLRSRHEKADSFPSGHVGGAAAYALAMAAASRKPWAWPLAAAAIIGVNISRVRKHEHWPTDVMVGDLIGIGGAIAAALVACAVRRRQHARRVSVWAPVHHHKR